MPRQRDGLSRGTHLLDRGATTQDWTPPGYLTLACPICLLRFHLFGSAAPAEDLAAWDPAGRIISDVVVILSDIIVA